MSVLDNNKYVLRKMAEHGGHALTVFRRDGAQYRAMCKNHGCAGYALVTDGRYPLEGDVKDAPCPIPAAGC